MIYEFIKKEKRIPYFIAINSFLPLDNIVNGNSWLQIDEKEKKKFIQRWEEFTSIIDSQHEIFGLSYDTTSKILKSLMIFFEKYYNGKQKAINDGEYISFENIINYDEEDSEKIEIEGNINYGDLYDSIKSLKPKHMYEYIRSSVEQLKSTWYFDKLVDYDKDKHKYIIKEMNSFHVQYNKEISISHDRLTLKNIYNYAKSLIHYTKSGSKNKDSEYIELPRFWRSLNKSDKKMVLDRLQWNINDRKWEELKQWFNLSGYMQRTGIKNGKKTEVEDFHVFLIINIQTILIDIVFEVLIKNGVLSQYVPKKEMTDIKKWPKQRDPKIKPQSILIKKHILNKKRIEEEWNHAYYFLTNKSFGDLPKIRHIDNKTGKTIEEHYLEYLATGGIGTWFSVYAMDWISQIGFFHRYINNRVIYVTGSTGVGKSTQVPKLFLYALKMIDYKSNGKCVCTIPSIAPTEGVAEWVSSEMGVPIKEPNNIYNDEIKTANYYIQYKHAMANHKLDTDHLILRFVTDGTLYQELKGSPILKKTIKKKGKIVYTEKNLYDVVIVDEAHQHNTNMDMILTMMRYATYYNNDIRLVIISATMDNDESTYRRYYRDINDNRLYPFDTLLKTHNIDRINIDRRLHISPPGQTTRHKIDEFYEPNKKPDDIVRDIINSYPTGDILLFQPGEREINDSIEELNKTTPSDTIAIPFFSKMAEEKRKFIKNLSESSKYKLTIPKNINYGKNYDELTVKHVPKGTYKRIIIVATNIVEASLTIASLAFVVDTGTQKTGIYNFKTRTTSLRKTPISEPSRLQRKGRVGRVGPGKAYYTYAEHAKEENKIKFNISISDVNNILFDMIRENNAESPIFSYENDPNSINNLKNDSITCGKIRTHYKNGIDKMIEKQYCYNLKFNNYYGVDEHYDYTNSIPPPQYYRYGYDENTITDSSGTFYIVHPEELCFQRNIVGDIIYPIPSIDCQIKYNLRQIFSPKINSFWNINEERIFLFKNNKHKDRNYFENHKHPVYTKTNYGIAINSLMQKLDFKDVKPIICFLYSRKLGCEEDIIKLIPMLEILRDDGIKGIAYGNYEDGKFVIKIDKIKSIYGNNYGDAVAIIKIANKIINFVNDYIFDTTIPTEKHLNPKTEKLILKQKIIYLEHKHDKQFIGIDKKILNKLIEMDGANKLDLSQEVTQKEAEEFIKKDIILEIVKEKLEQKSEFIKEWCRINYFDFDKVDRFIYEYLKFRNKIKKYKNKFYDIDHDAKQNDIPLKDFDKMLQIVPTVSAKWEENVVNCLLYGYGYKVVRRIEGTELYLNVNSPEPKNVYRIATIFKKPKDLNTTLNKNYLGNYLHFINDKNNELLFINHITPKEVQKIVPIVYSPEKFMPINYDESKFTSVITELTQLLSVPIDEQKSHMSVNLVSDYITTVKKIKRDWLSNYEPILWDSLVRLHNDNLFKSLIGISKKEQNKFLQLIINHYGQSGGHKSSNYNKSKALHIHNLYAKYIYYKIHIQKN
jgi:hypothetical protein